VFQFRKLKLAWKLPLMIAVPALLVVFGAALLQLQQTALAFGKDKETAYSSYVNERAAALERWLADRQVDVLALADSYAIQAALTDFAEAWDTYGKPAGKNLRDLYISGNPHPVGQKDELVKAEDGSAWSAAHSRHHVGLRSYQRARIL